MLPSMHEHIICALYCFGPHFKMADSKNPTKNIYKARVSFTKFLRSVGAIWILRGGGGWSMMVKGVAKFHTRHLGITVCLNVCVCWVSYRILSFGTGETPKV